MRRTRRPANGTTPRQVAPIAASTTPVPPVSTPAVSAPAPAKTTTQIAVPSDDHPTNRPNGIFAVPATIGTTAWITATKRTATSAVAPRSRRYASARSHRSAPIRRPSRVSRRRAPRTRPTAYPAI